MAITAIVFAKEGDQHEGEAQVAGVPIPGTDLVALAMSSLYESAATATRTIVPGATTSVALLAANPNRIGATILNDSTANLFIAYGTPGTITDYSAKVAPGAVYTLPVPFTGAINGVWDALNGQARITEFGN